VKKGLDPAHYFNSGVLVFHPRRLRALFMIENSPLSGEFQKGEAYSCQKEALLCYKKVVLTSVVAKESDNR